MSKSRRNGLLGVGGQRNKVSRRALRGGGPQQPGNAGRAAAEKQELLRKMRERNRRGAKPEQDAAPERDPASGRDPASERGTDSE
ncbi:hypothetical protein FHX41_0315 [Actinomadura hallensis]|uniref:Uncharacterized protein n=1 Tax=Actinomadura hallensis TaxID=337895 RepID=A0A543I8B4_9ACTN|nr:DUF6243 family protein [Actinomadura hallensis]TQM66730.1 hypothetical protein FHX41_0315 [Actinomadura hallensis]